MKRKSVGSGSGMRRSRGGPRSTRRRSACGRRSGGRPPPIGCSLAWVERVLRSLDTSAP
ncbi:MAG: hypothetical protein ACLRNQ_00130 [Flavonifractor plautii]